MSFIKLTGQSDILFNSEPKISLFNPRTREYDIYNIDKAEKQNIIYPHSKFETSFINLTQPNHQYNLSEIISQYDLLGGLILSITKISFNEYTLNQLEKITFTIDEAIFELTLNQIRIYDKFYEKIIFDSKTELYIKIPLRFFKESRNYIPVYKGMQINFQVFIKGNFQTNLECKVIKLDEYESFKIKNFMGYTDTIIDYQEEIRTIINRDSPKSIINVNYGIKELFWTYTKNNNPSQIHPINFVELCLENSQLQITEKKTFNKNQCTITNQLFSHNICDNNYYNICFAEEIKRQHPTGQIFTNDNILYMNHDLIHEYKNIKTNIDLYIVVNGFRFLRYYYCERTKQIKCRFIENKELFNKSNI